MRSEMEYDWGERGRVIVVFDIYAREMGRVFSEEIEHRPQRRPLLPFQFNPKFVFSSGDRVFRVRRLAERRELPSSKMPSPTPGRTSRSSMIPLIDVYRECDAKQDPQLNGWFLIARVLDIYYIDLTHLRYC